MNTRTHYGRFAAGAVLAGSMALFGVAAAADHSISVTLSGSQEVPPVNSGVTGTATVAFDNSGQNMTHSLTVDGDNITMAHLHCGSQGENGPAVVTLFHTGAPGIDIDGTLSSGTIDEDDIADVDCASVIGYNIDNRDELAEAIEDDDIYVNVHSVEFPAGAARGQLVWNNGDHDDDDNGNGHGDDDGDDKHDKHGDKHDKHGDKHDKHGNGHGHGDRGDRNGNGHHKASLAVTLVGWVNSLFGSL